MLLHPALGAQRFTSYPYPDYLNHMSPVGSSEHTVVVFTQRLHGCASSIYAEVASALTLSSAGTGDRFKVLCQTMQVNCT